MHNKLSQSKLNTLFPQREILFFEELTSTFDKIRQLELKDGLTVACSRQTQGSGRLGRKWESPKGGIYFTFALMPPFKEFDVPFITTLCALGVLRALEKYVPCKIKWPNDIVSGGKKICGILTRNMVSGGDVDAVLVGVGINANISSFPKELCHASSIKLIGGNEVDENLILTQVLEEIDTVYATMNTHEILKEYTQNCVNLSREVTVHYTDGRKDEKGICTNILSDGSMDVKTPHGTINVHSGEVSVKGIYE